MPSNNKSEKLLARAMLLVVSIPMLVLWLLLLFAFPNDPDLKPGRVFGRMLQVWCDGRWTLRENS
jgi:hypothetical protein